MTTGSAESIRNELTQDSPLTISEQPYAGPSRYRHLGKGVFAGLLGGLIGTIVMTEFQTAWGKANQALQNGSVEKDSQDQQRETEQQKEDTTMKAAGKLARIGGWELSHEQKKIAGPVVHYSFGTLQGALYGAVTELTDTPGGFLPGALFGAGLFALADEVGVPALGLSGKPTEMPISSHLYGIAAHLVYGFATEFARRGLRAAL
jgi:uncharacterized membrane protein YagU involved in acid resistance